MTRTDVIMRRVFIAGVTLLVAGVGFQMWLTSQRKNFSAAASASQAEPVLKLPQFNLVDQDGSPTTRAVFSNKVSIVQFMFTSCPLACPAMTTQMETLQKRLRGSGVQFVSLSFDPVTDSPKVLKEYATERFKLDQSNWRFLTEVVAQGERPRGIVRSIYANDLHQMIEEEKGSSIKSSTGEDIANINHSVNLFLVGPDGTVLASYNSTRANEMDELARHATLAMRQILK